MNGYNSRLPIPGFPIGKRFRIHEVSPWRPLAIWLFLSRGPLVSLGVETWHATSLLWRGYWTSIPLTRELSFTVVNWITYWPLALAFTVNCSMTALFLAPVVAKISKLVNTCVPLIVTLNTREPDAVQKVSAKCKRTVWLEPAANAVAGMV